jgi:DNA polymerase-3 subunit epsilon
LVTDVFKKEPGYYSWIQRGDFSQNTKMCFTKIWQELKNEK